MTPTHQHQIKEVQTSISNREISANSSGNISNSRKLTYAEASSSSSSTSSSSRINRKEPEIIEIIAESESQPIEILRDEVGDELFYRSFKSEQEDLEGIMRLVEQELSEPYNVYTFRYFLVEWPHLTFLVFPSRQSTEPIATIVCKQDWHRGKTNRGYIAMLSVDKAWRRRGIASTLVKLVIEEMTKRGAHEVVLETEFDNVSSLALYGRLGFLREKRIQRFYSNFKDAFRLILPLPTPTPDPPETEEEKETGRWLVGTGPEETEGSSGQYNLRRDHDAMDLDAGQIQNYGGGDDKSHSWIEDLYL